MWNANEFCPSRVKKLYTWWISICLSRTEFSNYYRCHYYDGFVRLQRALLTQCSAGLRLDIACQRWTGCGTMHRQWTLVQSMRDRTRPRTQHQGRVLFILHSLFSFSLQPVLCIVLRYYRIDRCSLYFYIAGQKNRLYLEVYNSCIWWYRKIKAYIKMFSSLSGVTMVFSLLQYLNILMQRIVNILCISSDEPYCTENYRLI